MRPTAQRMKWGQGGTPRQTFAQRVEEQRTEKARKLKAMGVKQTENAEALAREAIPPRTMMDEMMRLEQFQRPMLTREALERARVLFDAAFFDVRETPEQKRQRKENEQRRQLEREAADLRAKALLREAGPDGVALAEGEAVLIPSQRFEELTYGIVPEMAGWVTVFHARLGKMGHICIQPVNDAPAADVLLTRLMLCHNDEAQLWKTGNWQGDQNMAYFLPKEIKEWRRGNLVNPWQGNWVINWDYLR